MNSTVGAESAARRRRVRGCSGSISAGSAVTLETAAPGGTSPERSCAPLLQASSAADVLGRASESFSSASASRRSDSAGSSVRSGSSTTGSSTAGTSSAATGSSVAGGSSTAAGVAFLRRVRVTLTGGTTSAEASSAEAATSGSSAVVSTGVALRRRRGVFGATSRSPETGAKTSACGDSTLPAPPVGASIGASVCSGWLSGAARRRVARVRRTGAAGSAASAGALSAPAGSTEAEPTAVVEVSTAAPSAVVLWSADSPAGCEPVRSPPSGSFSSMDVLQFWLARARVSAATQGRRKSVSAGRAWCATAEVCLPEHRPSVSAQRWLPRRGPHPTDPRSHPARSTCPEPAGSPSAKPAAPGRPPRGGRKGRHRAVRTG
ncbi:putative GPI-anchored protein [Micromonospora saelicesensis]|nr:putative GPI-anchored protein [Micromonospora saelicesensis]